MPKISVIIPVYNTENYLKECLNSVINQTFKDIEIICVNDGSTDNSLSILEEYARTDSRIKIINQKNQGVSSSRNNGIKSARGEYIMFLDSDDLYKPDLCEKVVEKIDSQSPDIVMWGHDCRCDKKIIKTDEYAYKLKKLSLKRNNSLKNLISLQVFIWDKAFKKSFLENKKIEFPAGIKNAEDLIFCLSSFFSGAVYSFIPESLCIYTEFRTASATSSYKSCIKNDFYAYKYFFNTQIFQEQTRKIQIASTQHFLGGSIHYWRVLSDENYRNEYIKDIEDFLDFVKSKFSKFELLKMSNYQKLRHLIFKFKNQKFFELFDIKTTQTEKTFIFFKKKFKVKRWTKMLRERILEDDSCLKFQ